MEMSKKYINLCRSRGVQALCKWNAGDRFLAVSQDLFVFLEKILGWEQEEMCKVWVPNYDSSFEMEKKNLLWVPNLSQVISGIKEITPTLKKMALEFIDGKWSCSLHYVSPSNDKIIPIVNFAKTGKTACMKTLVTLTRINRK
ncbi:MAG: hypothetical protein ACQEP5_03095 [Actinomycetota bacterium]